MLYISVRSSYKTSAIRPFTLPVINANRNEAGYPKKMVRIDPMMASSNKIPPSTRISSV